MEPSSKQPLNLEFEPYLLYNQTLLLPILEPTQQALERKHCKFHDEVDQLEPEIEKKCAWAL